MSNKLVKLTPEEKERQETEEFLKKKPTRQEVANYINALFTEHLLPEVQHQTSGCKLGLMVLQAILVDKSICTGEEIQKVTETFLEQQKKEQSTEKTK